MAHLRRLIREQAVEIAALRAELAERHAQVAALIRSNPAPTWIFGRDSLRFLDVNDLALSVYGFNREEFLAMTIADIRPPEDVPALVANVEAMRGMARGSTGPWRHRHKDGRVVDVRVLFETIPFRGGPARLIVAHSLPAQAGDLDRLSPREREIFRRVAAGETSRSIAEQLGLSPKSVETYRVRFMRKLSLSTRADVVRCALAHRVLM